MRATLVAGVTLLLLWWFLRGVDLRGLGHRLLEVRLVPLAGAVGFALGHFFLRAWRWRFLLLPLGTAPYRLRLEATVAGYCVNNLLPARGGEVARPWLLARRSELPFSGALATVLLERLLDMITVATLFLISAPLLLGAEITSGKLDGPLLGLGVAGTLVVAGWIAIRFFGRPMGRLGRGILAWLPGDWGSRIEEPARAFLEGFAALRRGRLLGWVVLSSVVLWLDVAAATWLGVLAFGVNIGPAGSLFLMGWLALGMVAPTQAGVGGYHAACRYALTGFFAVDPERAAAVALVLHAASVVPVTLWGLVILGRHGIRPGSVSPPEREAEATPAGEDQAADDEPPGGRAG